MAKKNTSCSFSNETLDFIHTYVDELAEDNAAIFAGAGLSAPLGYVNWKELLRSVAHGLGLDIDRETNLVALAQYHFNERQNRTELNRRIIAEFSVTKNPSQNHEILARLPIRTWWTTNYDRAIERALVQANKVVDVKYDVSQLKDSRTGRDAVLYKMHGDVEHPESAILTKDDYEGYFRHHEPFVTALSGDLISKTFLFLGFSFTDPNIDYVMSRVRVTLRHSPKQHYCIMRREQRAKGQKKADYDYKERQQSFVVKDLARIGVKTIFVDEYSEITDILAAIEKQYRQRTIFIAGSADDFSPWDMPTAHKFISTLSSELIKRKFRVVTGFGVGVGPSVIAGALETIMSDRETYRQTQLLAKPFPASMPNSPARAQIYTKHREEMIAHAGIAIFMFGNKKSGKKIIAANGVQEEFVIAHERGLDLIPVGATGHIAEKLWQDVNSARPTYLSNITKTLDKAFDQLGPTKKIPPISDLVKSVITVIEELRKPLR